MLLSRKSGCKITTFPSIHKIFSIFFVFLHPDMAQFTDNELSILIPTYNCVCVELVRRLHQQAMATGIDFEIIVADDGSVDVSTIQANRAIATLPHCQFIERSENSGRAAIRNFLAQEASHAYLLYIDSDMTVVSDDFVSRYLACLPAQVVWLSWPIAKSRNSCCAIATRRPKSLTTQPPSDRRLLTSICTQPIC